MSPESPIIQLKGNEFDYSVQSSSDLYSDNIPETFRSFIVKDYKFIAADSNFLGKIILDFHPSTTKNYIDKGMIALATRLYKSVIRAKDYWETNYSKFGMPNASALLNADDTLLNIFSYQSDSQKKFERIAESIKLISTRTPLLERLIPKNIILMPENVDTGRAELGFANGLCSRELNTVYLYPIAFERTNSLIPNTNNLDRTIAHETSHLIEYSGQIRQDWWKIGGWKIPGINHGAPLIEITSKPEECVDDYAKNQGMSEDIAESIATAILNPELLKITSKEKYRLIENVLQLSSQENLRSKVSLESPITDQPEFPTDFNFMVHEIMLSEKIDNNTN